MPDSNGLPTPDEILFKLALVAPDEIQEELQEELPFLLASVLAEFEAPVTGGDGSGTGRQWHPTTETRYFDGHGFAELRVDDLTLPTAVDAQGVVTNPLVVRCYDTVLTDVGVKQARVGGGSNTLFFRGGGASFGLGMAWRFPVGVQNIAVTATWGNPVSRDVYEAIRCEVCYRLLVEGFVGLNGVGEDIKIGDYELNTSVGAINFRLTSPLTVFHDLFLKAIARHKERADRNWRAYGASQRMS